MKKIKYKIKSLLSVIIAVVICLSAQFVAIASDNIGSFQKNFVGATNYTLGYAAKTTSNQWVTFAVDKGVSLDLWGAYNANGIVLTEKVKVLVGQSGIRAYYKTGFSASKGTKIKARGQQSSKSGTNTASGRVDYQ